MVGMLRPVCIAAPPRSGCFGNGVAALIPSDTAAGPAAGSVAIETGVVVGDLGIRIQPVDRMAGSVVGGVGAGVVAPVDILRTQPGSEVLGIRLDIAMAALYLFLHEIVVETDLVG